MFKRLFRRSASSSNAEDMSLPTGVRQRASTAASSSTLYTTKPTTSIRVNTAITSTANSQAVVVVGDTLETMNSLSLHHDSSSATLFTSDEEESETVTTPTSLIPANNNNKLENNSMYTRMASLPAAQYSIGLVDLPTELIIKIAHYAGFIAATKLIQAHERFQTILDNPAAWHAYTHDASSSSDVIESQVHICTKIHTFDHLVFGTWDNDRHSEPSVYFEHLTFREDFDFLGGVEVGLSRSGQITSGFFEHRETLACYKNALIEAVQVGTLPPSAPHGGPPPGAKIDHSCHECERYNQRSVLKSIFVFDQVPSHPRWGKDGFSWVYSYPDGRRRLRVSITPFQGATGYTNIQDLPSVYVKKVNVNGVELEGKDWEMFQRLVQRRVYK
ncbi:hypothetical protein HDU78_004548 [Chytriomyces hyalinus]|nr:hypothetical protein HDU78_004548 [Chytriomyces hyalinus]